RETKILLRKAMAGLLPPEVLAPRQYRTGLTNGFSRARMRSTYPPLFDEAFGRELRLADLGIIDAAKLRESAANWRERGNEYERVNLFNTLRVEFWLRGLASRADGGTMQPVHQPNAQVSVAG
ncbi:MAG: asparagine synthase-related protein, partial [Gemmatimonadaceae bacterium]